jgi:hypothetical protein
VATLEGVGAEPGGVGLESRRILRRCLVRFGEDDEAVAGGFEASGFGEGVAEFAEFGDLDFDNFACIDADDEIAGFPAIDELVVGLVFVEEEALDDAGLLEEFYRAIDGGFADAEAGVSEFGLEFVGVEEAVEAEDGVEDLGSLWRVLEAFAFEGSAEDGAEGLDDFEGRLRGG